MENAPATSVGHMDESFLEPGHEPPLGDGGDVRADAALFLGFAAAPDNAALARAFAGQFTNSCHNIPVSNQGRRR